MRPCYGRSDWPVPGRSLGVTSRAHDLPTAAASSTVRSRSALIVTGRSDLRAHATRLYYEQVGGMPWISPLSGPHRSDHGSMVRTLSDCRPACTPPRLVVRVRGMGPWPRVEPFPLGGEWAIPTVSGRIAYALVATPVVPIGAPPGSTRRCQWIRPIQAALAFGSVKEKTEPPPGGWATQIRPPCASTRRRAIASPRPAPPRPASRERALSPR
jgi:hypothetical protein